MLNAYKAYIDRNFVVTTLKKRWLRLRSYTRLLFFILICFPIYYTLNIWEKCIVGNYQTERAKKEQWEMWNHISNHLLESKDRHKIIEYKEELIKKALQSEKGKGCRMPNLDPFAKEIMRFNKKVIKISCSGFDWVYCYYSECRVKRQILETSISVVCSYRDIIYESDSKHQLGPFQDVYHSSPYILEDSDHVRVNCTRVLQETSNTKRKDTTWSGVLTGFRKNVEQVHLPKGEESTNVLMFGFDSASKHGFMRRMPKTYKHLVETMGATVLNGYNIVGDGTPGALFPILSGKTELEFPDVRKSMKNNNTLDAEEFIFSKLWKYGFRTAYFEDTPAFGTFQWRFNGFNSQPADHSLYSFFREDDRIKGHHWGYCIGDTLRYKLMMNLTQQLLNMTGNRFIFTLIADISHNNFNQVTVADDDMVALLRRFQASGRSRDTLLFVFGDHGPRWSEIRSTLQGRLEERLPFMAIRLPDDLVSNQPLMEQALKRNQDVLTTPHDIHATILDALGFTDLMNPYRIPGSSLPRALSLLKPIPKNRSCSEAGIEPHWCACLSWKKTPETDPMHRRAGDALLAFINQITSTVRYKCALRTLTAIDWVMKMEPNDQVLSFKASDHDLFVGTYGPKLTAHPDIYQAKITVGPGVGIFEGSMTYVKSERKFDINIEDISRTNRYGNESACIQNINSYLDKFCYCNSRVEDLKTRSPYSLLVYPTRRHIVNSTYS